MGLETTALALGASASTASTIGTIGTALSAISAISSVVGGIQQQSAAKDQAALARETALAQAAETGRVAGARAFEETQEAERVRARQKVLFLKGGVDLEGSPLLVMEETRRTGEQNAEEIIKAGGARGAAQITAGEQNALSLEASGRRAFTSGLTSGFNTFTGSRFGQSLFEKE